MYQITRAVMWAGEMKENKHSGPSVITTLWLNSVISSFEYEFGFSAIHGKNAVK